MIKWFWVLAIILFIISIIIADKTDERKIRRANNIMVMSTAITFGLLLYGIITDYIDIMSCNYSFIKATIEIFKITWWRVPIMIICVLCGLA